MIFIDVLIDLGTHALAGMFGGFAAQAYFYQKARLQDALYAWKFAAEVDKLEELTDAACVELHRATYQYENAMRSASEAAKFRQKGEELRDAAAHAWRQSSDRLVETTLLWDQVVKRQTIPFDHHSEKED